MPKKNQAQTSLLPTQKGRRDVGGDDKAATTSTTTGSDPMTACDGLPHHWRKAGKLWRCEKCDAVEGNPIRSAHLLGSFYAGDKSPPPWERDTNDDDATTE